MSDKLARHRRVWKEKKILRDIYTAWYKAIGRDLAQTKGKTIELGAGSGNFKEFNTDALASDIDCHDWLDLCFDAHRLPFKDNSGGNIVMIDVLHHLADPVAFFHEAARVLQKGGRIVLIEPFPTPFSLFVYRRFHPEPFIMDTDYFQSTPQKTGKVEVKRETKKDPWDANQAAAFLLFFKHRDTFNRHFADGFKIIKRKRMSFLLYPASGGFENPSRVPGILVPLFRLLEILLKPLAPLLAFRCHVVLEKI